MLLVEIYRAIEHENRGVAKLEMDENQLEVVRKIAVHLMTEPVPPPYIGFADVKGTVHLFRTSDITRISYRVGDAG